MASNELISQRQVVVIDRQDDLVPSRLPPGVASTADAEWFFDTFRQGDLVEVVNSEGDTMEPFGNGFGDWNVTWDKWREGSALTGSGKTPDTAQQVARLRPAAV